MSLKKVEEVILTIEGAAFKGKGIGKLDGMAIFVPGTMPGDEVKARIIKRKKNYREAKLLEILSPSPDRIELDVAITGEEVALVLHRTRLEAPLPQRSRAPLAVIDIGHEPSPQRLEYGAHRLSMSRCHQQVAMIGHQHIGMHGAPMVAGRPAQPVEINPVVIVVEEDGLPVVAPLHHVDRYAREEETPFARHWAVSRLERSYLSIPQ